MAKVKYFIANIPLKEWCLLKGYSYSTATNFIARNKNKYLIVGDLLEALKDYLKNMNTFYYYEGLLFKEWCNLNGYSYNTAFSILNKLKSEITDKDELVKQTVLLLKKTPRKTQYFYKGQNLRDYCRENDLNYSTILSRIRKIKKYNKDIENDAAVIIAIEDYTDTRCKFFYNAMSLKRYCELNGYDYPYIYRQIKDLDENDAKDKMKTYFENAPVKINGSYKIAGLSLRQYCIINNYNYSTVKSYISFVKKEYPSFTQEEVVITAINYYKIRYIDNEKFFYKGEKLIDFLKRVNCSYKIFMYYLSHMRVDDYNLSDEIVNKCLYKCRIKLRNDLFKSLEEIDYNTCLKIAKNLSIDEECLNKLVGYGFSYKKAINFIWYFGTLNVNKLIINDEQIKKIIMENVSKDLDLLLLIGYYKSGLSDTRNLIIEKVYLSCIDILNNLLEAYSLFNQEVKEELKCQLYLLILEFIEKTNSNSLEEINSYLNNYIRGELLNIILKYLEEIKDISLNQTLNNDEKIKLDFIVSKNSVDREYISNELFENILTLSFIEQKVIILFYQKQFTKEEVALKLKITVQEVVDIKNTSLEKLQKKIKPNVKIKK